MEDGANSNLLKNEDLKEKRINQKSIHNQPSPMWYLKDREYSVYMHISPANKYYIGITSLNVKDRWDSGHGYRQHRYFFNAIKKYGWKNFKHIVIKTGLTQYDAKNLECKLIKIYESNNRNYGYNITDGGDTSNPKIRKKVFQYTIEGDFIAEFKSIREAERILKIDHNTISKCCRGILKSAGQYLWSFQYQNNILPEEDTSHYVCKIDKNLQVVKYYKSISDACIGENVKYHVIHSKCKNLPITFQYRVSSVVYGNYYCYKYDLQRYLSLLNQQKNADLVYQLDDTNQLIGVYSNFGEAGLKMNVHGESIRYACKNHTLSCGFQWLNNKYNKEDIAEAICIGSAFLIENGGITINGK